MKIENVRLSVQVKRNNLKSFCFLYPQQYLEESCNVILGIPLFRPPFVTTFPQNRRNQFFPKFSTYLEFKKSVRNSKQNYNLHRNLEKLPQNATKMVFENFENLVRFLDLAIMRVHKICNVLTPILYLRKL